MFTAVLGLRTWNGRATTLVARNEPTQSPKDQARLEGLLRRPVRQVELGDRGHTAVLAEYGVGRAPATGPRPRLITHAPSPAR
jgi:hypothetical protein